MAKTKKRDAHSQGKPDSDTRTSLKIGKVRPTQDKLVFATKRLKKAMRKISRGR